MRWRRREAHPTAPEPLTVPTPRDGVVQVCHPDWRGVRASAIAFGDPVLESDDLNVLAAHIDELASSGVSMVVIQGWPPGAEAFARSGAAAGLDVLAVSHSAPTQHGIDPGEAEAISSILELRSEGVLTRCATVKAGLAPALRALGYDIDHVPNRVPVVGDVAPAAVDRDRNHAGVFFVPLWRKNVATQVLAAHRLGWVAHLMTEPGVPYLGAAEVVVHGELPRPAFLPVMAAMDLNLNVTLSECHPMMPMESYRLGVPCLMSRTSDLFATDPELYDLTTVDQADDPEAIAEAARRLYEARDRAVELANEALDGIDAQSESAWLRFTGRG